jgi:GT2 family glycosyltransferase
MPLVSVIIPVYNGEKYIEEALDSVFAQTFPDYEIIVVNAGSTDGTEQRIEKYGGRLKYLLQEHTASVGASRNYGLRVAKAPLIAFLDADDLWLPAKLQKQVEFAGAHPEYGIITTDVEWFGEEGVTNSSLKKLFPIVNGQVMEQLLFHNWVATSAAMVRRECFDKLGVFDEEPGPTHEDWMMWMRIASRYHVYFVDEVLVRHRQHWGSHSQRDSTRALRYSYDSYRKLEEAIPQLAARPDLMREGRFRFCLRYGLHALQVNEIERARQCLKQALEYKAYSPRTWALLAAAYAPARVLWSLKRMVKACRKLLARTAESYWKAGARHETL